MRRIVATFVITVLALSQGMLAQDPQQGSQHTPKQTPKELDKYKIENVLPLGPPRQIPQAELEEIQKRTNQKQKADAMAEYRRTGQTSLTKAEIDDFLDEWGLKKSLPRFENVPVCTPKKLGDVCGVLDTWLVYLQPSVKVSDAEAAVASLTAKYNVLKHPTHLHDYDLPTGAYFVVQGSDVNAENLSKDPLVRYVTRDRLVIGSNNMTDDTREAYKKLMRGATKANPKATAPAAPAVQGVPFNLDRSDQRDLPVNNQIIRPNLGDNVDIYLLGGDIWTGHTEFASPLIGPGRTVSVFQFYAPPNLTNCDRAVSVQSQHDTSVFSLAAGKNIGMAPLANIVAYAPFKYDVSESVDSAATQSLISDSLISIKNRIIGLRPRGAVLMITFGLPDMPSSFDTHLNNIISSGAGGANTAAIVSAHQTSAGASSGQFWPQRNPNVVSVGFTDSSDTECSLNYGSFPCGFNYIPIPINMFAPGHSVTAAAIGPCAGGSPVFSDFITASGTSFSTPIVAGIAALFLGGIKNTTYYPHSSQVRQVLSEMSSMNKVTTRIPAAGVENKLGYNLRQALPVTANAASYLEQGARGAISASFGDYGITPNRVFIQFDCGSSCGTQNEAFVFGGATAGQVNIQVPGSTPTGTHLVKVFFNTLLLGEGIYKVNNVSPGMFTAGSAGTGTVSGFLLKFNKQTGAPEGEILLTAGGAGTRWNSQTQNAFLSLYGTGWRNGGTPTLTVNGVNVGVSYSAAHGTYVGVDQVNSNALPDSLNTNGVKSVVLTSQGIQSQPSVTVTFAP